MSMAWRKAIPQLISEGEYKTQADLIDALEASVGRRPDQSTVSRELAALGVRKVDGVYQLPPPPDLGAPIHDFAVTAGGCLVVVRTNPAFANVIGQAIDGAGLDSVLGTIAGDDTVFVATKGPDAIDGLRRFLGLRRR